jgi:CRP-like cAMP-binding protein
MASLSQGENQMIMGLLSASEAFHGLDKGELETVQKIAKMTTYKTNDIIFKEGDNGDRMFLIVQGVVEIWKSEGKELKGSRLARLKEGEIFGEMALFDREPRSASALAMIDQESKILVWTSEDILRLVNDQPKLGIKILLNVLKKISNRLRNANDAIHILLRANQYVGL